MKSPTPASAGVRGFLTFYEFINLWLAFINGWNDKNRSGISFRLGNQV
jgi:hypothetical protein